MAANPEAIAWYLRRSEDLLDDLRGRVESLRTRGGQIAGFSGAVLALAGANATSILSALHGGARVCAGGSLLTGALFLILAFVTGLGGPLLPQSVPRVSAAEVANYTSDRFIEEPDLWRVQTRTIRTLLAAIEETSVHGDEAARAATLAQNLFSAGLFLVGIALGILVAVVTF